MHIAIQTRHPGFRTAKVIAHPSSIQWQRQPARGSRIALPISSGTRYVQIESIIYCAAESNYCMIHLRGGERILISKTLKWVGERLSASTFIRAHASYIVNIDCIAMHTQESLQLEGGMKIPVARSRRGEVKALLSYSFQ